MLSVIWGRRRDGRGRGWAPPAIVIEGGDADVVISVHGELGDDAMDVLGQVAAAAIDAAEAPERVQLDLLSARSCSTASLRQVAGFLEQGILISQHPTEPVP